MIGFECKELFEDGEKLESVQNKLIDILLDHEVATVSGYNDFIYLGFASELIETSEYVDLHNFAMDERKLSVSLRHMYSTAFNADVQANEHDARLDALATTQLFSSTLRIGVGNADIGLNQLERPMREFVANVVERFSPKKYAHQVDDRAILSS